VAFGFPIPFIKFREDDANGFPLAGGKLWSYAAGTSTPLPTYYDQDVAPTHANTNPTVLDASGRANVWLPEGVGYKFILTDALGNTIYTQDNVQVGATQAPPAAGGGGSGGGTTTTDNVPAGCIMPFGGITAPTNWLFCDGAAISRSTYSALFTAIGTTFGPGNGSTTFNLPDIRGRFPIGKAQSGPAATLGFKDGDFNHVHTGPSHTHTINSHSHSMSHTQTVSRLWAPGMDGVQSGFPDQLLTASGGGGGHTPQQDQTSTFTGDTGPASLTTNADGTGDTGAANPPYIVLNYIIRT